MSKKSKQLFTCFNTPITYNNYTFQLFESIGPLSGYLEMLNYLRNEASSEDSVTIEISNGGGSLFTGIELFYAIRQCTAIVTTRPIGEVASAAALITLAGDVVITPPGNNLMLHAYSSWHGGPGHSPVDSHKALDKTFREFMSANLLGFVSEAELDNMLTNNRDVYYSGDELQDRLINLYKYRLDNGIQKAGIDLSSIINSDIDKE